MGYRDDRTATHARVDELERELAETKDALAAARQAPARRPTPKSPSKPWAPAAVFAGALVLLALALFAGVGGPLGIALGIASALAVAVAVMLLTLTSLLVVVPPNQLAVLSGRTWVQPDGSTQGFRLIRGGRVLRWPLVEVVQFMDLTNSVVPVRITNAYERGGLQLDIDAVANVKVAGDLSLAARAVERFLGQDKEAISRVAAQTLEGNLRGLIAEIGVDEAKAHPDELADRLMATAHPDLEKLGLVLDSFEIVTLQSR